MAAKLDDATRALAGSTIWAVAAWLEAHYDGTPYEIFTGDAHAYGYRVTVERIQPFDLETPLPCGHCPHPGHNGMCGKRVEVNTYCDCYGKAR